MAVEAAVLGLAVDAIRLLPSQHRWLLLWVLLLLAVWLGPPLDRWLAERRARASQETGAREKRAPDPFS
jgi:hypothetical protein